MDKSLAFVLSGGGSRGALQVGALYALGESGLRPDLLVGTSIGAVNAAFLALNGFAKESMDTLAAAWRTAAGFNPLPKDYVWLTVRAMFGRASNDPSDRVKDLLVAHGLTPELRFGDIKHPRLIVVSSDLNTGQPVLHGELPDDNVLEALLLSTALPPWFRPVRKQGRYLMDGGAVSNLPIEAALKLGATEIVALDLMDMRDVLLGGGEGIGGFLDKLILAVEKRQSDLELQLARARGIPLVYLELVGETPVPMWDFQHTKELIAQGYAIARRAMDARG